MKDGSVDERVRFAPNAAAAPPSARASPTLHVRVVCASIGDIGKQEPTANWPRIDTIGVGHYAKVEPQFAELALDNAISRLPKSRNAAPDDDATALGILRNFTGRGIIAGELGVPFFLPDPRDRRRIVAIAGMGSIGYFAAPELAFLALQLLWALSRLGRKHLATVLIGSGTGNLDVKMAVAAWMNGAALAIASSAMAHPIQHLTFVEHIPAKAEEIRSALLRYRTSPGVPSLDISVTPSKPIRVPRGRSATAGLAAASREASPRTVTRMSVERRGKKHLFGLRSDQASLRQDYSQLDLETILNANDELAARKQPDDQRHAAIHLFKLLVPQSFRQEFARKDPMVIECDNRTAQLHWEMMVVPGLKRNLIPGSEFLGMHPTVTRQFRNSFGGPPEPPPRFDHTLRVLIVADTDKKRPLDASREEAQAIAALFGKYGEFLRLSGSNRHVSVDSLIGPETASYDTVLQHLLKYPPYDILHFSGHCEYVKEDPANSGWLFSKGKKISAHELTRVDCVPGFVFSNACSSGVVRPNVTRLARRSVPSFAEAFFQRGVKNFVCAAWPVASNAARDFACSFYEELLGIERSRPGYMYEAMREARRAIWRTTPSGARTWGAYQHYGNPWYKL